MQLCGMALIRQYFQKENYTSVNAYALACIMNSLSLQPYPPTPSPTRIKYLTNLPAKLNVAIIAVKQCRTTRALTLCLLRPIGARTRRLCRLGLNRGGKEGTG